MKFFVFALALVLLGSLSSARAASPQYTITDLGTLGGSESAGVAVNDSGQVVGDSDADTTANPLRRAFFWSGSGPVVDLGSFDPGETAHAYGLDSAGDVVGSSVDGSLGAEHAVLVRAGEPMATLGSLTATSAPAGRKGDFLPGDKTSVAHGINDLGQVVGESSGVGAATHAFYWTQGNGMIALSGLVTGARTSAVGINTAKGTVIGYSTQSAATMAEKRAVRWSVQAILFGIAPQDLGVLPGDDASEATAINNSGQIVGTSTFFNTGPSVIRAFLYDEGANPAAPLQPLLPNLPSGTNCIALGIGDQGSVVGYLETGDGLTLVRRAFLFASGVLTDLNKSLPAGSGWVLEKAQSINASGQITGSGKIGGDTHAFLLTPASPVVPVPTVKVLGARKRITRKAKVTITGKTAGAVTSVTYRIGGKSARKAGGKAAWKFTVALKSGKNRITVIAHGPGGDSPAAKLIVIRRP